MDADPQVKAYQKLTLYWQRLKSNDTNDNQVFFRPKRNEIKHLQDMPEYRNHDKNQNTVHYQLFSAPDPALESFMLGDLRRFFMRHERLHAKKV